MRVCARGGWMDQVPCFSVGLEGLDEDDMPEINEETLPDEEAMARLGVVEAVEKFKLPVYGDNDDEESPIGNGKASNASKKRKPVAENTAKESANYNWPNLTDNGHDAFICFKYDGLPMCCPTLVNGRVDTGVSPLTMRALAEELQTKCMHPGSFLS